MLRSERSQRRARPKKSGALRGPRKIIRLCEDLSPSALETAAAKQRRSNLYQAGRQKIASSRKEHGIYGERSQRHIRINKELANQSLSNPPLPAVPAGPRAGAQPFPALDQAGWLYCTCIRLAAADIRCSAQTGASLRFDLCEPDWPGSRLR